MTKRKATGCPFCESQGPIEYITDGTLVQVGYCYSCHAVWRSYKQGKQEITDRLTRIPEEPKGKVMKEEICPRCWSVMVPDYDAWELRCPDPICDYHNEGKALPGLSQKQKDSKKQYLELRQQIFDLMAKGEAVPKKLAEDFKTKQVEYNKIRRFDRAGVEV